MLSYKPFPDGYQQHAPMDNTLSDRDLNAAIGWLAREDKIYFETDSNNAEYLYLSVNIYY